MKKVIAIFSICWFTVSVYGQLQKVNIGVIPVVAASTSLDTCNMQVKPGFLLYAGFTRKQAYTTLAYSVGNRTALVVNGIFLNKSKNQDMYLVTGKHVDRNGGYLGLGYEAYLQYALPFVEIGTDWSDITWSNSYLTIGAIFPLYKTVWERHL